MPLPGLPWSPDFMEKYEAALAGAAPIVIGIRRSRPGTVDDAVARYLGSVAFAGLAPTTRSKRRDVLERFRREHGDKRIGKLRPDHVGNLLRKLRPYAQRNVLKALRALMVFALSDGLIDVDPTVGVKLDRIKDTGGFKTWSEADIAAYRSHHKLGTRARLALELLYGTMQRRGDVIRLGRQHIQHGILSLRQQKTGAQVDIPVLPELEAAIDAMPRAEHLTFLVTDFGKPFTRGGLRQLVSPPVQRGRAAGRLERAWPAQGGRDSARRARLHRSRNHGLGRLDDDQGGAALHESGGSETACARCRQEAQSRNIDWQT